MFNTSPRQQYRESVKIAESIIFACLRLTLQTATLGAKSRLLCEYHPDLCIHHYPHSGSSPTTATSKKSGMLLTVYSPCGKHMWLRVVAQIGCVNMHCITTHMWLVLTTAYVLPHYSHRCSRFGWSFCCYSFSLCGGVSYYRSGKLTPMIRGFTLSQPV